MDRDLGLLLAERDVPAELGHPRDPQLDVGRLVDGLVRVADVVLDALDDGDLSVAELVQIGAAVRAAVIRARRAKPPRGGR